MPHLPVITDMFRVTLDWGTWNGIKPRNVIYIQCASGLATDIPGALNAAWHSAMWGPLPSGMQMSQVEILALDGSSSSTTAAVTTQSGQSGGSAGAPGQAVIVSFQTGLRGPANRGRVFLGPASDTIVTDGLYTGSLSSLNSAWAAFQTALQAHTPVCAHHVVSIKNGTHHVVTNYRAQQVAGGQLRRLKQLR